MLNLTTNTLTPFSGCWPPWFPGCCPTVESFTADREPFRRILEATKSDLSNPFGSLCAYEIVVKDRVVTLYAHSRAVGQCIAHNESASIVSYNAVTVDIVARNNNGTGE